MHTPRWKKIANAIHTDIKEGRLKSGDALPSETDLAAQWNVSRVTAHRAMHELHQQGIVVRRRRFGTVVAAPETRRTGHIAVFFNGPRDFLEQEYLSGIRTGLPDEYDLLVCYLRNDPEREVLYLERMRQAADGIICMPTCAPHNTTLYQRLLAAGTPLVCIDRVPENLRVDAFISANYEAALTGMRFLTARGHRRVAHFTEDRMFLSSIRERYEAYHQVMIEAGNSDARIWLRTFPLDKPDRPLFEQMVQDALFALRNRPDPPTAVFCLNDYLLCAVIQACYEQNISIPDDLEILSFNDCPPFVPYVPKNIHRIVQRAYEMGQSAAERLCQRLRGEEVTPEIVRVDPLFYPMETPSNRSPGNP